MNPTGIDFDDTICCWCSKELISIEFIIPGSVEDNGYCSIGCWVKDEQRIKAIQKRFNDPEVIRAI